MTILRLYHDHLSRLYELKILLLLEDDYEEEIPLLEVDYEGKILLLEVDYEEGILLLEVDYEETEAFIVEILNGIREKLVSPVLKT